MFKTEKELSELLGEVEKEFKVYLAKAEETVEVKPTEETPLAKSEDDKKDEKPEAKEDKADDKKPEAKDEAPKSDDKKDAPPAAPSEDKAPEAPAADAATAADAAAAPAAPTDEGHGYDAEDVAHMQAMYASMSRAELIAHHDAIKAVLDGMGMDQQAQAPAAPAADAPPAAPVDKCGDMSMQKSETDTAVEVKPEVIQTSQETEILKSEIAAKDSKINELQKTLDAVTAFVTKLVEKKAAPAGKAITHVETIAKSDSTPDEKPLSKDEITAKLTLKASDPKLAKSDREAINAFYATGQINLTGISHLLK